MTGNKFAWAKELYPPRQKPDVGEKWAYRIKRTLGEPAQPVEILQFGPKSSKHKVRVKYLAGDYHGLDEWVSKSRLVVPWDQHDAWWQDELNQKAAYDFDEEVDDTDWHAVAEVFFLYGSERVFSVGYNSKEYGLLDIEDVETASSILDARGLPVDSLPGIYQDRFGKYRASYSAALMVAKHLCREFPREIVETVARKQQDDERYSIHGKRYGKKPDQYFSAETMHESLEEHLPVYNLVRSWCDSEVVEEFNRIRALENEVQRLRGIILEHVRWLENYGQPRFAKALLTRMERVHDPP